MSLLWCLICSQLEILEIVSSIAAAKMICKYIFVKKYVKARVAIYGPVGKIIFTSRQQPTN